MCFKVGKFLAGDQYIESDENDAVTTTNDIESEFRQVLIKCILCTLHHGEKSVQFSCFRFEQVEEAKTEVDSRLLIDNAPDTSYFFPKNTNERPKLNLEMTKNFSSPKDANLISDFDSETLSKQNERTKTLTFPSVGCSVIVVSKKTAQPLLHRMGITNYGEIIGKHKTDDQYTARPGVFVIYE